MLAMRRRLRAGRCAPPMPPPRSWSASAAPRRCRRGAARPHPAGGGARRRGEDRVRLGGARRAAARMARAGPAHRLHQRLLRSPASRPRPGADAQARAACDRLVVGLNSDASVKRLKGEGRPIQDVDARADVLAALEAVDLVVVFDEDTPLELIRAVRADRAGQGRRLSARGGGRPRGGRGRRRRGDAGRSRARTFDHQHREEVRPSPPTAPAARPCRRPPSRGEGPLPSPEGRGSGASAARDRGEGRMRRW